MAKPSQHVPTMMWRVETEHNAVAVVAIIKQLTRDAKFHINKQPHVCGAARTLVDRHHNAMRPQRLQAVSGSFQA